MRRQLYPKLIASVLDLLEEGASIPESRKEALNRLVAYLRSTDTPKLNFVCTHNSRRSHLAQAWAWAAAMYFEKPNVEVYSGGTEATALYPQAGAALKDAGFEITVGPELRNARHTLKAGGHLPAIVLFSKRFDDPANPSQDFCVVTVCSDAEEACPFVPGATARVHIPYEDPKAFDDTKRKAAAYIERSQQIGTELLWAFGQAYG
jgi:protein-tyrosine-phosphatase